MSREDEAIAVLTLYYPKRRFKPKYVGHVMSATSTSWLQAGLPIGLGQLDLSLDLSPLSAKEWRRLRRRKP